MIENIKVNEANCRIDQYLQEKLKISRNKIQELIKLKLIKVNNNSIKNSHILEINDIITISKQTKKRPKKHYHLKLDILYEDNYILVINKPAGLLVHKTDTSTEATLVDYLIKDNYTLFPKNSSRSGIVHRLDKMTEGLMLITKTKESYHFFVDQFKKRLIKKKYYAMSKGNISNNTLTIDQPIDRDIKKRNKFTVANNGKNAVTHITVLKRYNSKTLCDVEIETGRTHQIRVHMKFIGHPVLGDTMYSTTSRETGQLLQAYCLQFKHPKTLQSMSFHLSLSKRIIS